ncbi:nitroreductase/quinone reductase family protein [Spongiactinospora sp. TRM90649]|uniref:nitroreductase/quinone reductase family protein n=1 Tax=Spongiactinospora sp. TRM90649 TaxID=3031114 RepID=UPI0023F9C8A9|nr:nitroreductase/quinone reductase family protein [Spongiactinospora sp. TRM90649]MDF5752918.1 nitroreductase/quinone reductase family protein [Spongiactinospora sp. TRM90649]
MPADFNQQIIDEFRANGGKVGGPFEGGRLLLLTTTGAKSGARRTNPVGYLPDGDRMLIIASAAGAPKHPAWYHNLVANPEVTVEDGTFTYQARAEVLEKDERDAVFARATEQDPGWGEYQRKTSRVIPVVALVPTDGDMDGSPADNLKRVHDAFRRELSIVRRELASAGPTLGAQLRINCLTVCQGVSTHHGMEDRGLFPYLAQTHPELAPVIERLGEEHEVISRLLGELQALLTGGGNGDGGGTAPAEAATAPAVAGTAPAVAAAPAAVAAEVDRLISELESHLDYEEEQLIPILAKM